MENDEEDFDVEDPSDERKNKIVRAVLLFCAIVMAGVTVYTTYFLFVTQNIDVSFSPPEDAANFSLPDADGEGTAWFDFERNDSDGNETKTYKNEPLRPSPIDNKGILPSPLIISEELGEGIGLFVIVVLIEILVILWVYRKVDNKVRKKKN